LSQTGYGWSVAAWENTDRKKNRSNTATPTKQAMQEMKKRRHTYGRKEKPIQYGDSYKTNHPRNGEATE